MNILKSIGEYRMNIYLKAFEIEDYKLIYKLRDYKNLNK
jgi:hypothetical protein